MHGFLPYRIIGKKRLPSGLETPDTKYDRYDFIYSRERFVIL